MKYGHCCVWIVLLAGWCLAAWAGRYAMAEPMAASQELPSRVAAQAAASRSLLVDDVSLGPQGELTGRVIAAGKASAGRPVAGVRVVLLRQSQAVAETATDADGRFAIRPLPGGLYDVVASAPDGACRRHCRLWSASAAPPHALREVALCLDAGNGPIVRGQRPFPVVSFGRVATIAGIVGGAIAVPAIYNTKKDEFIPASP